MSIKYPITELYAWVVDDPSRQHGIVGGMIGALPMQAVTSKRVNAESGPMRDLAEFAHRETGLPVKLQRFALIETVETI